MNGSEYARGYTAGLLHQALGDRDMLTALGQLSSADERRGFRDGYHDGERAKRLDHVEDMEEAS